MAKVIGIGGLFFKAKNPKTLAKWYETHLGVPIDESYGGYSFDWKDREKRPQNGYTIWSPFSEDTEYIAPSEKDFMFNFIVDDLKTLLEKLQADGIDQAGAMEDTEFGKFAWIIDPEGNKIELWEPGEED